jgi:hypothetical protein
MLLFGCHGPGYLSFILGTQRYTLQPLEGGGNVLRSVKVLTYGCVLEALQLMFHNTLKLLCLIHFEVMVIWQAPASQTIASYKSHTQSTGFVEAASGSAKRFFKEEQNHVERSIEMGWIHVTSLVVWELQQLRRWDDVYLDHDDKDLSTQTNR